MKHPLALFVWGLAALSLTGCETLPKLPWNSPPLQTPTPQITARSGACPTLITITDANDQAVIMFSTDGSLPGAGTGMKYGGAFEVSQSLTVTAQATAPGYVASQVATLQVSCLAPPPAPTFVPPEGSHICPFEVSIIDSEPDAVIHYTLNGAAPQASTPVYRQALSVNATTTLRAMATLVGPAGLLNGPEAVARYTCAPPAPLAAPMAPEITPDSGRLDCPFTLAMASATPGAELRYTLDGSEPTLMSARYTAPLSINQKGKVRAKAYLPGTSAPASAITEKTHDCRAYDQLSMEIRTGPDGARGNSEVYAQMALLTGEKGDICLKPGTTAEAKGGFEWITCRWPSGLPWRNSAQDDTTHWEWAGHATQYPQLKLLTPIRPFQGYLGDFALHLEQHPRGLDGWDDMDVSDVILTLTDSSSVRRLPPLKLLEVHGSPIKRLGHGRSDLNCRLVGANTGSCVP